MHLSDHDLRQCDDADLETLTPAQARALLGKALADLKAARAAWANPLQQFAATEYAVAVGGKWRSGSTRWRG